MPLNLPPLGLLLLTGTLQAPAVVDESACEARRLVDPFCGAAPVVWCDAATELDLARIAQRAAPILWFAADEPLLPRPVVTEAGEARRPFIPIPQPLRAVHPTVYEGRGQEPAPQATVYWHIGRVLTFDGQQSAVNDAFERGRLLVSGVRTLTLSFAFYYERDEGLNGHYNDLEGMEVQLDFDEERDAHGRETGRRRISVGRVTGLGHGSALLSNILQVRKTIRHAAGAPDVVLPITMLVEQGKHASAPDRNGDGVYTPGYDVNIKVPDAWGVRDVFGSGVVASAYRESMTKPRLPDDRIGPDPAWFREGSLSPDCFATPSGLRWPEHAYRLERFPSCESNGNARAALCDDLERLKRARRDLKAAKEFYKDTCLGGGVERQQLAVQMKQGAVDEPAKPSSKGPSCNFLNMLHVAGRFPQRPDRTGFRFKYQYGDHWYLQPFRYLAPAVRVDGNSYGPSVSAFIPFGLPKFAGWFTARGAYQRGGGHWGLRVDLSYSPSIARLVDWYVAAGYDWRVPAGVTIETDAGPSSSEVDSATRDRWAIEGGIQLRQRALWLRAGVRAPISDGQFGTARFVAELGYGPQPRHARVH